MTVTQDEATAEVEAKLDGKAKTKRVVTTEHKQAMREGRDQSRKINQYLSVISATKPRRGRQRTVESIQAKIEKLNADIPQSSPVVALRLTSEVRSLQDELALLERKPDVEALEADFVSVAKDFSERKKIPRSAWRTFGVPSEVLEKAGI